ncbi:ABC transporter substrate-binding protein [Chachezhania sediminis]|uniref:ABC transporter substrate-binding protein n=1 Tax=Chachezhania sediminis TaxID=2599291 RepID=UPI00131D3D86|nr:ABC transporter substrate-binding protein [Chachezhania sediminis]
MAIRGFTTPTLLALPLALGLATAGQARDLTIVGFGGGYQDSAREHLFEAYEKATGTPVSDDVYNGEMAKIYAMVDSGNVTYDIVMIEAPEMVRACEDGVLAQIDYDVIEKSKFIPSAIATCGVGGTGWGAAMFYNNDKHPDGPQTFADFWDTEKFPGKRSLRSGPKMTLEAAIMADGVPAAEVYDVLSTPEGVDRAFAKLDEIKDDIVWWTSGAQPLQFVGSGEVDYALAYTGRVLKAANTEGLPYSLHWDTLLYSIDYWTVIAGSEYEGEAMKMIDFITDMDQLKNQAAVWAISPAVKEFIADPEMAEKNSGAVLNHSDEGLFIDTEFWIEHGDDLNARFASWAAQ